jgi:hypothetical protein
VSKFEADLGGGRVLLAEAAMRVVQCYVGAGGAGKKRPNWRQQLGEIGEEGEQISRIKMQKYKAKIKM